MPSSRCLHSDLGGLHQGAPATAQQGRAGRGREGQGQSALSKHLLGRIHHVEEAVLVVVVLVNLGEGAGHIGKRALVDQKEESLCRVQLEATANNLDQFSHRDVVRHQELGLVQQWEVALAGVTLDDHRDLVGVLLADLLHVTLPLGKAPSLPEGLNLCIHGGCWVSEGWWR